MRKLLQILGLFFIGMGIFMLAYFTAYTIDGIYDGFQTIREHEDDLVILSQKSHELKSDLYNSQEAIYLLMGELVILRNNYEFIIGNLEKEFAQSKNNYPYYEDMSESSAYIINASLDNKSYSVGTGVIVSKKSSTTYIMINKHVCDEVDEGHCYIEVLKFNDFKKIPLEFVKSDSVYDVSLWKTYRFLPNKKPIKGVENIDIQDKIYSVGNYLGFKDIYTEGTFAGYEEIIMLFNMPCVYGCSGSGVYDKNGNLVSLIYAVNRISPFQVDTTKALGIPTEVLKEFLKDIL